MAASLVSQLEQIVKKWRRSVELTKAELLTIRRDHQKGPRYGIAAVESCADDLEAICRAWQAERGWRDIESAPKDGTWLLVYSPTLKIQFYPMVVFWDDNGWTTPSHGDGDPGFNPTHWMPLPDPPVAAPAATEEDPDEAMVEDVSGSLHEARRWMRGRCGFCYRVTRLPDGSYGNEEFVTEFRGLTR